MSQPTLRCKTVLRFRLNASLRGTLGTVMRLDIIGRVRDSSNSFF